MATNKPNVTERFREKINELRAETEAMKKSPSSDSAAASLSPMMIIAGIIPFVVFAGLYMLSPSFVQQKEGGKSVFSTKKTLMWTGIATLVAWAALYGYSLYSGTTSVSTA